MGPFPRTPAVRVLRGKEYFCNHALAQGRASLAKGEGSADVQVPEIRLAEEGDFHAAFLPRIKRRPVQQGDGPRRFHVRDEVEHRPIAAGKRFSNGPLETVMRKISG